MEGLSDSSELLKPSRVTDTELQNENQRLLIELGNLTAENEKLRADYAALLESSTVVTNKLREEVREMRSQLEQERAYKKDVEDECWDKEEALNKMRAELVDREKELAVALAEVLDLKQKLAAARELEDLQENSEIDFDFAGKAGELVSWLRKTVGKALPKQVTVKEVQKILEGGDN